VKHWPILIIFEVQHRKKHDVNNYSFNYVTSILLVHYLAKFDVSYWTIIKCTFKWSTEWRKIPLAVTVSQKCHASHITSFLSQHVLKMSASSTCASAWTLTPLVNSMFNNRVTQSCPLSVDASFQLVNVEDLSMIGSLFHGRGRDRRWVLPGNGFLYTDRSHVSVVTLEWSQIRGTYNTPDTVVKDRQQKQLMKWLKFLRDVTCQKLLKLATVSRSYLKNNTKANFFWDTAYSTM